MIANMPKASKCFVVGFVLFLLCVFMSPRLEVSAQIKPVYDQGALGLGRLLKRLNTSASVMMIGAHPDDEDTALLAYLARGENARTAYLSLTRGDGGQNIIGPELGEALGVIRTEELLQARKLDGVEQYFTRAYDYGFSKTLDEAKQKWDEKIVLCDAVRAIRNFRPLVVVAQFTGTPTDGHGQHQYSGYLAPLAVKAAADPKQCSDDGSAWEVKKFYVRSRSNGEGILRINTGKYDPMLGRSYFEIAMEARSQHRSQEQGVLEIKGEQYSTLSLLNSRLPKAEKESGVFDGIDTSWQGMVKTFDVGDPVTEKEKDQLAAIQRSMARALKEFDPNRPNLILPILVEGRKGMIDFLRGESPIPPDGENEEISFEDSSLKLAVIDKVIVLHEAVRMAAGLQIDALADRETAAPGEEIAASVKVYFPSDSGLKIKAIKLRNARCTNNYNPHCTDFSVKDASEPPTAQNSFRREIAPGAAYYSVKLSDTVEPTQPYWLEKKRESDLFLWDPKETWDWTLPFQGPNLRGLVTAEIAGIEFTFSQPVEYRFADDVRGELRRPMGVVPVVSVSLDQDLMIVARGPRETRKNLAVTVTNNSSSSVNGKLTLSLPQGWSATAGGQDFSLSKKGESTTIQFSVKVPGAPTVGTFPIAATATIGAAAFSRTMRTLTYPHIQTHRIYSPAATKTAVIDLKTVPSRIGYIAGSGDRVPQAIGQMGFGVEMIDERTLASGDLSRFDVIVVGIRAYQVRADIVAHNKRLLDFANAGGTLIVQYQLPAYAQQNLTPFPAQQGPRVSDELAKVTILDAAHPIFNTPNKITDADFVGWVQERNLYNFSTMDAKYTGLLESHDANEAENKGGLVVADVGKGKYIYCSYSLFRQLPAGVPGAYRLLANMLSSRGTNRVSK